VTPYPFYTGLRLTTNVLVSNDYGKERCAKDIDLFGWNRKICNPADYKENTDIYGEVVNEKLPNVTGKLLLIYICNFHV
jgi:hypothetical protein